MKFYTIAEIAKLENMSVSQISYWAKKNNIQKISSLKQSAYLFTEEDYLNFKNRKKTRGNPNFGEDFHKNRKKN